ncbi:aminotransferase class I/II-fold pyridoxal phosphate-dependent enzyme [Petrocella sp. FN5]|uniref:aminotransferase class I/II-fold pyridoxal phosphate-dependent enzyme n=1 Tax=Petrocella sp. FN5 TaxID=3032002 RepID=UPI0023DCD015|nr:aminotransferase class I/II-fold pyridoxal phosphate-dependent enzyme [Petrocella sp. FN5]MDF1618614.1 aminotransferase class I/II-fold pyridoxal phosphate-dependent enzyme [Petrocella sp. FN5]
MRFAKRMDQFGESIFTQLLEVKKQRTEAGEFVVDLSVGTPNIPPAEHIREALRQGIDDETQYIYAINDKENLLEAVAKWYKKRYDVELDPKTEICSLLGSQEGLAHISLCVVDEGDVVLVPDPCYPVFADGPILAGAEVYYMPQKKEHNYIIQLNSIPKEVLKRAKMILVSYPNNPTTAMAPDWFYKDLIAFARQNDLIIVHDNAYSELVFDDKKAGSFLAFEGAREVGVEFNSLSKTYGMAGARIGFCVGNAAVVSRMKRLKSNIDYGMFLPVQRAAIAAITGEQQCVEVTRSIYQSRRDVVCEGFTRIGWMMDKPEATMFVWASIPSHYRTSSEFAMDLVKKTGLIVTPGSAFGPSGEGYVRLALVQNEEVLRQAIKAVEESGILKALK